MLAHLPAGHEVEVHCLEGSAPLEGAPGIPVEMHPFGGSARPGGFRRLLLPLTASSRLDLLDCACRRVAEAMESGQPDTVIAFNSMYLAAPPVLRHLAAPGSYFCYEYPRHIYEPHTIRRTGHPLLELMLAPLSRREKVMDRASTLSAGSILCLSSYMQARLKEIYGREASVVRPGVDGGFFRPASAGGGGGFGLSVGALWPYKGHELSLRAAAAAGLHHFVVVADREFPGYRRRLQDLARRLGVRLLVLQRLSDPELRQLYRDAAVVLCCQKDEPYGLVPLEAMACGAPVVAVAEGGFPENIEDGVTGILVPRDEGAASAAVSRLLADRGAARSMGVKAREWVISERSQEAGAAALAAALAGITVS